MTTSGETAIATTDNNWVDVLTIGRGDRSLTIINTGTVAGFLRIGTTGPSIYLPAGPNTHRSFDLRGGNGVDPVVSIKRITDGSNVTGVYGNTN